MKRIYMVIRVPTLGLIAGLVICVTALRPAAADFQVNTYTLGDQQYPDVATDSAGNFVIVWQSEGQDGLGQGVYAQRFSASGLPAGTELLMNQVTLGDQQFPGVAYAPDDSFYVLYESFDGSSFGIAQRHFASDGTILSPQSTLNSYTTGAQTAPAVNGGSVVLAAWESDGQDGSGLGVFTRPVDLVTSEAQVNVTTSGNQLKPAVGCNYFSVSPLVTAGAVAWESGTDIKLRGIGELFSAELAVNTYMTGVQTSPVLACSAPLGGNLLVVWESTAQDGDGLGIFGRLYDASMSPLGPEFQINQYTASDQRAPDVTADADGNFLVVWQSSGQDGSGDGIFGRLFDSSGTALGNEFRVNEEITNSQTRPAVAAQPDGNFVVAWTSLGQDGDGLGVFARRFVAVGAGETATIPFFFAAVSVTTPNEGLISVMQSYPAEYSVFSSLLSVTIDAPPATAADPLVLVFEFPDAQLLLGLSTGAPWPIFAHELIKVYRNGLEIQDCTGAPGTANPDPCVESRVLTPGGDVILTVLTSAASQWDFTLGSCPATVDPACIGGFGKASLSVQQDDPANQKLTAKLAKGPALGQTDLGNPLAPADGGTGTIVALCMYDDGGNIAGQLYVARGAAICGSEPCWSSLGNAPNDPQGPGSGYKYKDVAQDTDGVRSILYKAGQAGTSKAIVKASGSNLPAGIAAALEGSTAATVQLRALDGECFSATLNDVKHNQNGVFKAK